MKERFGFPDDATGTNLGKAEEYDFLTDENREKWWEGKEEGHKERREQEGRKVR